MKNYIKEVLDSVVFLPRYLKKTLVVFIDICLCIFCTWLAFLIRLDELIFVNQINFIPSLVSISVAIPIFWFFGLYRTIFRYAGASIFFSITQSIIIYSIFYFLVIGIYKIQGVPRSIGVLQPIILFLAIISFRLGVRYIFTIEYNFEKPLNKKNVLIYGAGQAGRQLLLALENSPEFKVIGFLDDNDQLHRQDLFGKFIYDPSKLENIVKEKNISLILLALPEISRKKRFEIIEHLSKYQLTVKTLPSISEIVGGRISISDIKDLNINDLLNRREIKPKTELLIKNINHKNVLVTGAGGTIGAELCRQISRLKPNKLLLLELSEFSLYKIYEELITYNKNLKIIPLLGNVMDQEKLEKFFETFEVNTIYHTAAYKHVPLVEENICEGVKNNIFGTIAVANASIKMKISNLVLISSDKAVRPTNIMGASKRLSELYMQAIYNNTKNTYTNFSIVRFGNVLESSGSVIPKFKKQIKEGGPISLTHKDITRYFMTVNEAAQLVIQAGAMGKKSEVFILDMGKSVKIKNLIHKMIKLSGLSIKDNKNPYGDIEIKIIGLRPGEKLYEELLIGDNPQKTSHSKIYKTTEVYIPFNQLEVELNKLRFFIENNMVKEIKNLFYELSILHKHNSEIVDHIYVEEQRINLSKVTKLGFSKNKDNIIKIK